MVNLKVLMDMMVIEKVERGTYKELFLSHNFGNLNLPSSRVGNLKYAQRSQWENRRRLANWFVRPLERVGSWMGHHMLNVGSC